MHNLAVLYAEGIDGKPDYKTAAQWFRKAAEHGVADSQYNLGILYARGIGVEQNLAESYKWFALAAAQGDQDAAKKRDDVGARLDAAVADGRPARCADLHGRSRSRTRRSGQGARTAAGTGRPRDAAAGQEAARHRRRQGSRRRDVAVKAARPRTNHVDSSAQVCTDERETRRHAAAARRIIAAIAANAVAHACNRRVTRVQIYLPIADLPVNIFCRPRDGARGRLHLGHVRDRRRLPDDAAADLHRHLAGGRGRERRRAISPPPPSRARSAIGGKRALDLPLALMLLAGGILGTAGGVWLFTLLRSARPARSHDRAVLRDRCSAPSAA